MSLQFSRVVDYSSYLKLSRNAFTLCGIRLELIAAIKERFGRILVGRFMEIPKDILKG